MVKKSELQELYSKVIAKAWRDPEFKKKLLTDPKNALREMKIDIPEGQTVRFIEERKNEHIIVMPLAPTEELNDEELNKIAAAGPQYDWVHTHW